MIVARLSKDECLGIIKANRLARLACASEGQPYVIPIYYAFAGGHVYSFTMQGRKLEWMRRNPNVCLQVDDRTEGGWRSVVVTGKFEELPDKIGYKRERDHAWQLLSQHANWWEPGAVRPDPPVFSDHSPHVFYRVSLEEVSGRNARREA